MKIVRGLIVAVIVMMAAFVGVAQAEFQVLVAEGDIVGGREIQALGGSPAISNHEAAFHASFPGGHGFFTTTRGLVVANGATIGGKQVAIASTVASLNEFGQLVFQGVFDGTSTGIFTKGPFNARFIAGTGSVIDGHALLGTVAAVQNDFGQVFFIGSELGGNAIYTPAGASRRYG